MANIRKISEEDVKSHNRTMQAIKEYFNVEGIEGSYLMCDDNFIYIEEGYVVLFQEMEDNVDIRSFEFDEDYNIIQCDLGEHTTFTKMARTLQFKNDETGIIETIQFGKRPNDLRDEDGFNGIVCYSQYDCYKDRSVNMTYQQIFNGDECTLYPMTFMRKPRFFEFNTHVGLKNLFHLPNRGKRYARMDTSYDCTQYTHITINEFGLFKTLSEGAYSLQREKNITRYFREICSINKTVITTFPYGTPYKVDDLFEYIKSLGMKTKPEQWLIDFMNGKYPEDYERYLDILSTFKKMNENKEDIDGVRFQFSDEPVKKLVK